MKKKNIITLSIALNTFRELVQEDTFTRKDILDELEISHTYFTAMVGPIFIHQGKGLYKIKPELVHTQINQKLISLCFEKVRQYQRDYHAKKKQTETVLVTIPTVDDLIEQVRDLKAQLAEFGVRITIERQVSTWEEI